MEVGALTDSTAKAREAITLEALPASDGDCLLVSCPTPHGTWRLLMDTGREETWPALRNRLSAIPVNENDRRHIDLVILSHIDVDHIGAAQSLFTDETLGLSFGDVWFNGRQHLTGRGVAEGEALGKVLSSSDRSLPWNVAFKGYEAATPGDWDFREITVMPGALGSPCCRRRLAFGAAPSVVG